MINSSKIIFVATAFVSLSLASAQAHTDKGETDCCCFIESYQDMPSTGSCWGADSLETCNDLNTTHGTIGKSFKWTTQYQCKNYNTHPPA
jgi:hypothetical protein